MSSPTFNEYLERIQSERARLLSTKLAMETLLAAEQEDIDKQFDEKQGSWTALKPYTVEKKKEAEADPRILHETKSGSGLRLRDAYKQTGHVEEDGILIFDYPIEKPYAEAHQIGSNYDVAEEAIDEIKRINKRKKKRKSMVEQRNDKLDREYEDRFFR